MASYLDIHIGPYMLVRKLSVDSEESRRVCINEECTKHDKVVKSSFCPECGKPPKNKMFPIKEEKRVGDIMYKDEFVDEMVAVHNGGTEISKDWHVLIPNHHIPNGVELEDSGSGWAEIKPDRMVKEIGWMVDKYAKLIAEITMEFGADNVRIEWGIVKHYN